MCIETLWEYACSGNIDELKAYFTNNEVVNNQRYFKFGHYHSLIMGAFNNQQYEIVDYLLSEGETITSDEWNEIYSELRRLEIMKKLVKLCKS